MAVYIVQPGDEPVVKIGSAEDVASRVATLQGGLWLDLKLLREIPGDHRHEFWLHRRFAALRLKREWFRLDALMLTIEVPDEAIGQQSPDRPELIERVMAAAGGAPVLARALGIDRHAIYQWRRVPHGRAAAVERLTGISKAEMRPDLWGDAA